jgi:hypothetical protein
MARGNEWTHPPMKHQMNIEFQVYMGSSYRPLRSRHRRYLEVLAGAVLQKRSLSDSVPQNTNRV